MPREHGKDGAFVETVSLEDVLGVFDAVAGPVILSADVSDELECSRETARRKLEALHERGDLDRRKVSRRVIYWRPDEATGFDSRDLQGDPTTTLADTEAVINLDALSFDRDLTLARREQLREWLRHAADHDGGVSKSDFGEWWTDERGDVTGYNSRSFWQAFAKSAMKQSDRFSKPNMRTYRYVGDNTPDDSDGDIYDPTEEFQE